jgi:hypothetical protein
MSQNRAEGLDEDKIGGDFPPEEPLGADEYGTTAAEERWDEPLEERIAREQPDVLPGDPVVEDDEVDDTFDDAVQEHEAPIPAEEDAIHPVPDDDL